MTPSILNLKIELLKTYFDQHDKDSFQLQTDSYLDRRAGTDRGRKTVSQSNDRYLGVAMLSREKPLTGLEGS